MSGCSYSWKRQSLAASCPHPLRRICECGVVDAVDRLLGAASDQALTRLAERLAPFLTARQADGSGAPEDDGWLSTADAAKYIGITANALHKLTAARAIDFEQSAPGCKCWFRRSVRDAYRRAVAQWRRETSLAS
jgi:hypothetical protein